MAKVVAKNKEEKAQFERPKFLLKVYSFDYFFFHDVKSIEKEHNVKLTKSENMPINFNVQARIGYANEEDVIQIQVKILIQTKHDEGIFKLAEMLIAFDYLIENYKSYENNFPPGFLTFLCNISIGTSRGLLGAKLSNTYLQNLIMPIIYQQMPVQELEQPVTQTTKSDV